MLKDSGRAFRVKKVAFRLLGVSTIAGVMLGLLVVTLSGSAEANGLEKIIGLEPEVARQQVAALISESADEQSWAVSDGLVTLDEYQRAVKGTLTCLDEKSLDLRMEAGVSFVPTGPTISPDRFAVSYSYLLEGGLIDQAKFTEIEKACQDRHQRQVETIYQTQLRADEGFLREQVLGFDSCLQAEGLKPLGSATVEAVVGQLRSYHDLPESRIKMIQCFSRFPSINEGLVAAE